MTLPEMLTDFAAIPAGEGAVIILRPRHRITPEHYRALQSAIERQELPANIKIIVVEDCDVMVVGDAEIRRDVLLQPADTETANGGPSHA